MATLTISDVKILLRHDTSQNWFTSNPVLREGELGFESDTGKSKVGDGSTSWNSLNYLYALPVHTHVGTEIVLTGYSKPDSTSAITVNDTLNQAIGKLEKSLDEKQEVLNVITDEDIASAWGSINPFSGGGESSYVLPVASANTLGGIKVGNNLSIDASGVLSATDTIYTDFVGSGTTAQSGLVPAPPTTAGTTKFLREDGSWEVPSGGGGSYTTGDGIDITNDVISLETASANDIGGIKVGDGLNIDENGVLSTIGGGTGNASGVQSETLYKNDSGINGVNSTITLSKSWKEFDLILIISALGSESPTSNKPNVKSHFYFVDKIKQNQELGYGGDVGSRYFSLQFTTDTSLVFTYSNTEKVYEIIGIKFSKNLSEQMYSNVLYENSSGVTSGTITLNDDWNNYDFAIFHLLPTGWQGGTFSYIMDTKNITGISIGVNTETYMFFTPNGTTATISDNTKNIRLVKVIGYKLAKGGYSGIVSDARMTVKSGKITTDSGGNRETTITKRVVFDSPMPDTNYDVVVSFGSGSFGFDNARLYAPNLSKTINGFDVKVWCVDTVRDPLTINWIAIRPNSYTREGMVEDVLFSNASGVNSGTINLSGNISDYDLIDIQLYNSSIGYTNQVLLSNFLSLGDGIKLSLYDTYAMTISLVSDNSINIPHHNSNSPYITKITGIKFGRYVSGVAVDTTVTENSDAVITSGAVYDALQNIPSGGGGSSITVDSTITQGGTNPVEGGAIYTALGDKADKSTTYTKTEVDTALSSKGDVTTNTDQNITGTKTFVGSKKVGFKQSTTKDKLGFTLYSNTGTERGYLEFNPTNTVDGVTGLMTLGNYATSAAGLTQVGFRRYSSISGASGAYNLLMPLIADARTPFNLTTTYTNFYLPLGVTDGTTMVKTDKRGVLDISSLFPTLPTASTSTLGGVKVGDGLSIEADGTISVAGSDGYTAEDLSENLTFTNLNGIVISSKEAFLVGNVLHLNITFRNESAISVGGNVSASIAGIPFPLVTSARGVCIEGSSVIVGQISKIGHFSVSVAVAELAAYSDVLISIVYPVSTSQD